LPWPKITKAEQVARAVACGPEADNSEKRLNERLSKIAKQTPAQPPKTSKMKKAK
jgi:hypothetical protein